MYCNQFSLVQCVNNCINSDKAYCTILGVYIYLRVLGSPRDKYNSFIAQQFVVEAQTLSVELFLVIAYFNLKLQFCSFFILTCLDSKFRQFNIMINSENICIFTLVTITIKV